MRINNNLPAINAQRNLGMNNVLNAKSMEKLSSGLRINRAADDAAGLSISETMRAQIKGLTQASRNSQDAISLIQTAEGALTETHSILHRMRQLAVQSSNDTYTANDRNEMQKEVDQLRDELNRIANTTSFNNKNLLDGSASALVSSDKATTQIIMRGGLRTAGVSAAGTYKVDVDATAGLAQIQKSSIFKNAHAGDTVQQLWVNEAANVSHVSATNIARGSYVLTTVASGAGIAVTATGVQFHAVSGSAATLLASSFGVISGARNASIFVEVGTANASAITLNFSWYQYNKDGSYSTNPDGSIVMHTMTKTIGSAGFAATSILLSGYISMVGFNVNDGVLRTGDRAVINVQASGGGAIDYDQVTLNNTTLGKDVIDWNFNADSLNNKTNTFSVFALDSNGVAVQGKVGITLSTLTDSGNAATFNFQDGMGEVASLDTQLKDIDRFYDASGKFLVDNPQTITLIQGDGARTSFSIFGSDTLNDLKTKLNTAISTGLGQGTLVSSTADSRFVSYITKPATGSIETTEGTFVLRSVKAGEDGVINVIADQQIMNALGLADGQTATDSRFNVTVTDANDPTKYFANNLQISGNNLLGIIHPNVDVKFDSNADVTVSYNATTKNFDIYGDTASTYTTFVHLVDNTQVFQIGANELQNMGAAVGNMNANALGVGNILVTDVVSASKGITNIDQAIARVSTQRSSLGAVQNRLEHTINNLGVAAENMTASESRIRDVDMALEMMEFTRLNILSQASTAMLAQANQQPQAVLQLLGR